MKKLIILVIPILLLTGCGCEIDLENENVDSEAIEECRKKGGKAIIEYCHNDKYICKVICELEKVEAE